MTIWTLLGFLGLVEFLLGVYGLVNWVQYRRMSELTVAQREKADLRAHDLFVYITARERHSNTPHFGDMIEIPSSLHPGISYHFATNQQAILLSEKGQVTGSMCIHAQGSENISLPWFDQLVALILTAKYKEREFLDNGNISWFIPDPSLRLSRTRGLYIEFG